MVKIWLTLLRRLARASAFSGLADDAKSTPSLVYFLQIADYMGPASVFTPQWVVTISQHAVATDSKLISASYGFLKARPATEMVLHEAAAHALASTVSGANLWEAAPAGNKYKNRATPMEARLAAEVDWSLCKFLMPFALEGIRCHEKNSLPLGLLAPTGLGLYECTKKKLDNRTGEELNEWLMCSERGSCMMGIAAALQFLSCATMRTNAFRSHRGGRGDVTDQSGQSRLVRIERG